MRVIAVLVLAIAGPASAIAAIPGMVHDINVSISVRGSDPRYVGSTATQTFFAATDEHGRRHIWRTDGTSAGTVRVATPPTFNQFTPGVVVGNRLFFSLRNLVGSGSSDWVLWVSDGTESGTRQLVENATAVAATLSFALIERTPKGSSTTAELWRSDGTPAGTFVVAPQFSKIIQGFVALGDEIYLNTTHQAVPGHVAHEIWVSDGSAAGTGSVFQLDTVMFGAGAWGKLAVTNDAVYFRYTPPFDSGHNPGVWRIDAATHAWSGIRMVRYEAVESLASTPTQIFFTTYSAEHGRAVWSSDGAALPVLVYQGATSALRSVGSRALFNTDDDDGVWSSDGTLAGTQRLADFSGYVSDSPTLFLSRGNELWATDATPSGTRHLFTLQNETIAEALQANDRVYLATMQNRLISASVSTQATEVLSTSLRRDHSGLASLGLAPFGIWFSATHSATGVEPYVGDGTAAGTRLLKNIADETVTDDSTPADFVELNGVLYFVADDGVTGREVWRSDGTSSGTRLFADVLSGAEGSRPEGLFVAGDRLYFSTNAIPGLWTTDGTAPPVKIAETSLPPRATFPGAPPPFRCPLPKPPVLNGYAYFSAHDDAGGWELWRTDGTTQGTARVIDLWPGTRGSSACRLVKLNDQLFFFAYDEQNKWSLWKSDGTASGTVAIADAQGAEGGAPIVFNGAVYFATRAVTGAVARLWKSNALVGDAVVVYEAPATTSISEAFVTNNRLLFSIYPTSGGATQELWSTDGTTAGTSLLADSVVTTDGAMLNVGSQLFFTRTQSDTGAEPWRTDGTVAGTRIINDLVAGVTDSAPIWFANFRGTGIFLVPDANGDATMWRTNGNAADTTSIGRFDRVAAYETTSDPFGLTLGKALAVRNHLFFLGSDVVGGIELFALENEQPLAGDDSARVGAGSNVAIDVLANDRDTDGALDATSIRIVTPPTGGTATVTNGTVSYFARQDFSGTDSFTYVVADSQGRETAVARVAIEVTAVATNNSSGGNGGGGSAGIELLLLSLLGLAARKKRFS